MKLRNDIPDCLLGFLLCACLSSVCSAGTVPIDNDRARTSSACPPSGIDLIRTVATWAINSGGPATKYFGGNSPEGRRLRATDATIDTTGVPDPPPQEVYQSERWGYTRCDIGGLEPNGTYVIRLHFVETEHESPGKRQLDVHVNGAIRLRNYDIFAAAGAKYKAVAESLSVAADPSGSLVIEMVSVKDYARCSALELRDTAADPGTPGGLGPIVAAVNWGGNAVGLFQGDSGPGTSATNATIDTEGVAYPAPQIVYQSERFGDGGGTIDGLTPGGLYVVRLHFAELDWDSSGQRLFDVYVNDDLVLDDYDIVSRAGGKYKAVAEAFEVEATPSGTIGFRFTSVKDLATCNGIEILRVLETLEEGDSGVLYVDDDGPEDGDGSSWSRAYKHLQDALGCAKVGHEIRVAQGTYRPDQGQGLASGDTEAVFTLIYGVAVRGGYAGLGASDPNQRDVRTYATVLSGDLAGDDEDADLGSPEMMTDQKCRWENANNVVTCVDVDRSAVLDGFAISGGYYGGLTICDASPTITNCLFRHNMAMFGGAVWHCVLSDRTCEPLLANCVMVRNYAHYNGGAVYVEAASYRAECRPVVTSCAFVGNTARENGGALCGTNSESSACHLTLTNCTFLGNQAANAGGALYSDAEQGPCDLTVTNGILWANQSSSADPASAQISGGLPLIEHCCIQGWPGEPSDSGNTGENPRLTPDGHLTRQSPCIDACLSGPATDRDGDVRPNPAGGAYDMGADEFVDTDADGLPDWWERYATGSPTDLKPHEDFDGDGRLNLPEYERSSRGYPDLARAPDLRDIWSSYRLPISEPYEMPDSNAVPSGKVVYVDKSAPGRNDGTSWTDAYLYLQDALAAARAGDEIRVAQGAYYPDEGLGCEALDRGAAFHLTCSVRIRGGYAGSGGEDPNDRDIHRFRTVLTGDLAGNDAAFLNAQALLGDPSRQDNSTHVVLGVGTDSSTVLDGFVICGGNADGGEEGGGLYDLNGNTVIANCIFAHNTAIYGAGMGGITKNRSNLDDCYPALVNCLFVENAARTQGGGLFCRAYRDGDYHPTLTNCRFAGNYAGLDGGAICNWSETDYEVHPTLVQCVFVQNQAGQDGGGICCDNDWERTYPTLTNCAFLGNTAGRDGGGMMGTDTTHTLYNCLFSGNRAEQYGGALYARRGIMSTAPELVNCTVVGNTAAYSGGLGSDRNAKVELVNCILWRNADMRGQTLASQLEGDRFTVRYCCVQGWSDSDDEGGNRGLNPIFADAAGADDLPGTEDDDLRLLPGSPCVDAGDSGALPQMLAQDLAGGDRIVGACVDMGAFESTDPRVFLDIGPVVVVEGETGTFGVALLEDPGRPVQVTVTVASGDPDITTGSETTLCFDSGNYATPQVVVLAAAQDEDVLDGEVLISIHAPGVGATYVVATEQDDDVLSVLYVDARAQGAGTGTSWTDAFTDLQQALQTARALPDVNEIRVAQGTYRPAGAGQNEVSFELINGVAIKGGYAGIAAADPDARDIRRFQTILSGDLEGDDPNFTREWDYVDVFDLGDPSHNSFHVITDIGSDATAVLDGVTIAAGHAGYYGSGGGAYIVGGSPTFVDCRFERNLSGNYGGAVYCERGSPQFRNCVFTFNLATWGGGVYLKNGARPVFIDCLFEENDACDGSAFWSERWATIGQSALVHPVLIRCTFREYAGFGGTVIVPAGVGLTGEATIEDGLFADETRLANADVTIAGQVRITGQWRLHRTLLTGTGAVSIGQEAVLSQEVLGWPIVSQALVSKAGGDVSQVQCNLTGTGVLKVVPKTELVIEGQARAEVKHIQCDGLLRVRGNAEVHGAQVDVTQASFEGNAIVSNSVITAEAGVPYGQFFIEETARISHNEIHADGDRYMDLDPAVFDGLIANDNRIHVTVAEGIGRTRGGLLELRGRPGLIEPGQCHAGSPFLCQTEIVPEFGLESWTIEELHLVDGAKVNLTNRFDFQAPFDQGGGDEVLYVRDLYLGKDSVLNTAFNTIYYQNLHADPCSIVTSVPLLGFSLNNIAFDDAHDFLVRVTHNNKEYPKEEGGDRYSRIHVSRVEGLSPDPNGVMRMCNLRDVAPQSPTFGQNIGARAQGLFAKSNEQKIQIRFEYLFCDPGGAGELVIYLTDSPELLAHDDPNRALHYLEVARRLHPPAGRPGSAGSDTWGIFEKVVSREHLDFIRGTRIELELLGPEGTCVLIDNWDPVIGCEGLKCGDVAWPRYQVNAVDFLAVLSECGRRVDVVASSESRDIWCLDGFFSTDGYITPLDALAVDWSERKNLCPDEFLETDLKASAYPGVGTFQRTTAAQGSSIGSPVAALDAVQGEFLVAGKRYQHYENTADDFLSDRLYGLDHDGNLVSGPFALADDRLNTKLVRDPRGVLYQLSLDRGLVRIVDNVPVARPSALSVTRKSRYGLPANVYIGFQSEGPTLWGRPLLDAAFDDQGFLYVVPVAVVPATGNPYVAAAKLRLDDEDVGSVHSVVELFDELPPTNDDRVITQLREIEVDRHGRVYVLNCHYNRSDWLWVYDSDWQPGVPPRARDLYDVGISAPVGLCVSAYDDSRLYLSSSKNQPDANGTRVYVLSTDDLSLLGEIELHNMGHVTDIAEDPVDGTICVVGFQMPQTPSEFERQDAETILNRRPPYHACLAIIPYASTGPIKAICPSEVSPDIDIALPLSVAWTGVQQSATDADYSEGISVASH